MSDLDLRFDVGRRYAGRKCDAVWVQPYLLIFLDTLGDPINRDYGLIRSRWPEYIGEFRHIGFCRTRIGDNDNRGSLKWNDSSTPNVLQVSNETCS